MPEKAASAGREMPKPWRQKHWPKNKSGAEKDCGGPACAVGSLETGTTSELNFTSYCPHLQPGRAGMNGACLALL
jgi:hypothetical protein